MLWAAAAGAQCTREETHLVPPQTSRSRRGHARESRPALGVLRPSNLASANHHQVLCMLTLFNLTNSNFVAKTFFVAKKLL